MTKKSDITKEVFIKAADELFLEHGYDNVSVEAICSKAGKAKGLFFYHFDKKENIVKYITDRQIEAMSGHLSGQLSQLKINAMEKMDMLMNVLISKDSPGPGAMRYFKDSRIPEWLDLYAQVLKDKYVFPIIYALVREGIDSGMFAYCTKESVEIIYLGISQFIHKNHHRMSDSDYYRTAVDAIGRTLEIALGQPAGSINIK